MPGTIRASVASELHNHKPASRTLRSRLITWIGAAAGIAVIAAASLLLARPRVAESMSIAGAAPACGGQTDFLVRSDPLLTPVQPPDCSRITQSPPEFTWPPLGAGDAYEVQLTFPDGHTESRATKTNGLIWDKVVPAGDYRWRVKSSREKEPGAARRFAIADEAVAFLPPTGEAALERARATPHPRTWANDTASPMHTLKAERARGFAALLQEVEGKLDVPVQPEPASGSIAANYDDTVSEQKRTLAAAFAYAGTKEPRYGREAARRLMAQAAWSTTGPISFANNDMASRNVAWTLALGYDWMHDYLTASQRGRILEAIRVRTAAMYQRYVASGEIAKYPYDSHGNLTLTITAAIALLVAGDIPEADDWVRGSLRTAISLTSPWGGTDGGFANGTTQAVWDTGSNLLAWYVFKNAAGVEMEKKEWVRNHARYLAYFVPPGTPAGLFGDGQEQKLDELWARIGKALSWFAPSPIGRWYAAQMKGEDESRLELLLAPRVDTAHAPYPAGTPNAAYFPSIGWVAMHSDLADPGRASVYFKSSPYGSYNHSHGDQNSFVVNYRGKRLAIASGYYDGYGTAHWKDWYKQTRSSNAITFDGGQGQGFNEKKFSGEITRFETDGGVDVVTGEAARAYGGALRKARRTLVYFRPGVVLVHDVLSSDTPRTWEWNIHALRKMTPISGRQVLIENEGARMCVEMLASPAVAFTQNDRYTAAPERSSMNPQTPPEWHGAFVTASASQHAEFVALMRIGSDCSPKAGETPVVQNVDGGMQVTVNGKTARIAGEKNDGRLAQPVAVDYGDAPRPPARFHRGLQPAPFAPGRRHRRRQGRPLPVRRQGRPGREYGELLRLYAAVQGAAGAQREVQGARPRDPRLSLQRLRQPGARQQPGDRRILRSHLCRQIPDVREDLGEERRLALLRRPRAGHG